MLAEILRSVAGDAWFRKVSIIIRQRMVKHSCLLRFRVLFLQCDISDMNIIGRSLVCFSSNQKSME